MEGLRRGAASVFGDAQRRAEEATARLQVAREAEAGAAARLAELAAEREKALEADDYGSLAAIRSSRAEAEDALASAQIKVRKAAEEERAATAAAEQDRLQRQYRAAEARVAAILKKASAVEEHAKAIRSFVRSMAETDLLVAAVNADLPTGAEPLLPLGGRLFSGRLPKEVVREERIEVWVGEIDGAEVPAGRVASIIPRGDGRGLLPPGPGNGRDEPKSVLKRRARRLTVLPAVLGHSEGNLAASLSLPGLSPGAPIYTPVESEDPNDILKHIDQLEQAREHIRQPEVSLKFYEDTST